MQELEGKVALVTGGASGIGLAMVTSFAANGMRVVMADIEEAALAAAADSFSESNANVQPVLLDVTDAGRFEDVVDEVERDTGEVAVLCNNAGVGVGGHIADMTPKDWQWVLSVNLQGVINGLQACAPRMRARGAGHIVNTASMAGQIGMIPNLSVYCASKFAVVGLSESAWVDLREEGVGISVLCPNLVRTNIMDSGRNRPSDLTGKLDNAAQILTVHVPDAERATVKAEMLGAALDPAVVGDMVVEAVKQGELYIFTHPETGEQLKNRFDGMLAACARWDTYRTKS